MSTIIIKPFQSVQSTQAATLIIAGLVAVIFLVTLGPISVPFQAFLTTAIFNLGLILSPYVFPKDKQND